MGDICIGERMNDFDTPFLDYGKFIIFLQSVGQVIYVKKLLKVLKAILPVGQPIAQLQRVF